MAITITVAAAKKLPHPTEQYGSIQATVSLQGEAGGLGDVAAVVRDLFAAAQSGVDQHLTEQAGASAPPSPAPISTSPLPTHVASPQQRPMMRPSSAGRGAPRRGIPPISDAQRRLLDRLLDGDPQRADAVCHQAGVSTIGALNMKQASEAIDALKATVPA
jgi:hypothetical protein